MARQLDKDALFREAGFPPSQEDWQKELERALQKCLSLINDATTRKETLMCDVVDFNANIGNQRLTKEWVLSMICPMLAGLSLLKDFMVLSKPDIIYFHLGGKLRESRYSQYQWQRNMGRERQFPKPLLDAVTLGACSCLFVVMDASFRQLEIVDDEEILSIARDIDVSKVWCFRMPYKAVGPKCPPVDNALKELFELQVRSNRLVLVLDEMKNVGDARETGNSRSCFSPRNVFGARNFLELCGLHPERTLFMEWSPAALSIRGDNAFVRDQVLRSQTGDIFCHSNGVRVPRIEADINREPPTRVLGFTSSGLVTAGQHSKWISISYPIWELGIGLSIKTVNEQGKKPFDYNPQHH